MQVVTTTKLLLTQDIVLAFQQNEACFVLRNNQ